MILPYHSKLFSKWQNSLILILDIDKKKRYFCTFQKVYNNNKKIEIF
jgi:hypothetical protein